MKAVIDQKPAAPPLGSQRINWRSVAVITAAALIVYFVMRSLPTGTNLSHMDFKPGGSSVEFCDPANPQFMPVVSVKSPVTLQLSPNGPVQAGIEAHLTANLTSASGKPVTPEDLLVVHAARLHLMLIDPSLADYQHVHPEPGTKPGEWTFAFMPKSGGRYRVYADFTPAATGRGLYAAADLPVAGPNALPRSSAGGSEPLRYDDDGFVYTLVTAQEPRAGSVLDLTFSVRRPDGAEVPLGTVMDAYAHLVAFDTERTGFAHLHPKEADLSKKPDAHNPRLTFQVTIPKPGRYVIWAQTNIAGRERVAPFNIDVGQ